ncbi:S-phase kinase-associated protein 1A-like protein [Mycena olivaceomarginata]|nr:S-phase kinase-associated protein 1A-like protein [Mycena olivaceomarginata]
MVLLLVTCDGEQVLTEWGIIERSALIKGMLDGPPHTIPCYESDQPIPLPNVSSGVLKKVLEYCEHHRGEPLQTTDSEQSQHETRKRTTDISEWDQNFLIDNLEMLSEIINAANYLDIQPLLDVGCQFVVRMLKGKTPEEMRKIFNTVNDLGPEQEMEKQE